METAQALWAIFALFAHLLLHPVFISYCFCLDLLSPISLLLENPWLQLLADCRWELDCEVSLSPAPLASFWKNTSRYFSFWGKKCLGHAFLCIPHPAMLVTELPQLKGVNQAQISQFSARDVELTGD